MGSVSCPEREKLHLDEAEGIAVGFTGGDRPVFF
jgi:hypothetical protein